VQVHLVDGTYELFRHHYGRPEPGPYGATVGVLSSMIGLLEEGATHVAVASDHVIESFRNDLWPGYKTSAGMPPELLTQIPVLEEALVDLGIPTWAMVELEADDALASAARVASADSRVHQVVICTPDKDLGQCVVGDRVVQLDRRQRKLFDENGIVEKFGVGPASIPDYLALVGDAADGYPGIPGWGAKSTAAVLRRYEHIDAIPLSPGQWDVGAVRNAATLSANLKANFAEAILFRRLATLETDADVGDVDSWRWRGPTPTFSTTAERLGAEYLSVRAWRHAKNVER
jgi:5'-3' exonuclease